MTIAAFLLAPLFVAYGALIASDFSQMLYKPSVGQTYFVLRHRALLVGASISLWGVGLTLHHAGFPASLWLIAGSAVAIAACILIGFVLTGYILFRTVHNPQAVSAERADAYLSANDEVIGVAIGDVARAYPVKWITRPHVVEDTLAGENLAVTYCALSHRATTMAPIVHGRALRFIAPTQLENNLILYDVRTGNMVHQLLGRIVSGPDQGEQLALYPTLVTSWAAWKRVYPHTDVFLYPPGNSFDRAVRWLIQTKIVAPHRREERPFFPTVSHFDPRMPNKTEVMGLCVADSSQAYAMDYLREHRVLNETIGDTPLLVAYDAALDMGNVFYREYEGRRLSFTCEPDEVYGQILIDDATGSRWDMSGRAVAGALQGTTLEQFEHANRVLWFSWVNVHRDTRLQA